MKVLVSNYAVRMNFSAQLDLFGVFVRILTYLDYRLIDLDLTFLGETFQFWWHLCQYQ